MAVFLPILVAVIFCAFSLAAQVAGTRNTISLDGTWQIADSVAADTQPDVYQHLVPAPGLAHSANPPFKNVDEFQSRQLLSNLVDQDKYSKADFDKLGSSKGISHQERNYFWYRRTFNAPPKRAVALLRINKAGIYDDLSLMAMDNPVITKCPGSPKYQQLSGSRSDGNP